MFVVQRLLYTKYDSYTKHGLLHTKYELLHKIWTLIHRVWTLKHKVSTHIDDKEKSAGVDEDDGGGHHGHEEGGDHADLDVQCRVHTV